MPITDKYLASLTFHPLTPPAVGPDARRMAGYGGHLNLQYGEVVPHSILRDVIDDSLGGGMDPGDVFYDLGSGSGKIPFIAALWTGCGKAVGIEYAQLRHDMALQSLETLKTITVDAIAKQAQRAGVALPEGSAERIASVLRTLAGSGRVTPVHGDFLKIPRLEDATVIFINNTVFEAPLMLQLAQRLASLPRLRKLVVIKALCYRHSGRCERSVGPCTAFVHPPRAGTCDVSGALQKYLMMIVFCGYSLIGQVSNAVFYVVITLWYSACRPLGRTASRYLPTTPTTAARACSSIVAARLPASQQLALVTTVVASSHPLGPRRHPLLPAQMIIVLAAAAAARESGSWAQIVEFMITTAAPVAVGQKLRRRTQRPSLAARRRHQRDL